MSFLIDYLLKECHYHMANRLAFLKYCFTNSAALPEFFLYLEDSLQTYVSSDPESVGHTNI